MKVLKNIDVGSNLLRRLYISSIASFVFIIFLVCLALYWWGMEEKNALAKISSRYATQIVDNMDLVIHELKINSEIQLPESRMGMFLKYYGFVDAAYVLDDKYNVLYEYKDDDNANIQVINCAYAKCDTASLNFYGFESDELTFKNDKNVYAGKFNFDGLNDNNHILIAYKRDDRIYVVMVNLRILAREYMDSGSNNFLIGHDGYVFAPYITSRENRNIYDVFNVPEDWRRTHTGLAYGQIDSKWRVYSIDYIEPLGLGVYSQRFVSDLFAQYGTSMGIAFFVVILLGAVLWELINFAKKSFITPLYEIRKLVRKLKKGELHHYDFSGNKNFYEIYNDIMNLYFKSIERKLQLDNLNKEHDLLFKNSDLIILYVDAKTGNIISCSKKALEFYGYSAVEFSRLSFFELEESSLYDRFLSNYGATINGVPVTSVHKTKNGALRYVQVDSRIVLQDLNSFRIMVIKDLTHTICLENSKKDTEDALQNGPVLVFGVNDEYRIEQMSENVFDIIKYTKDHIIETKFNFLDMIIDDARKEHIKKCIDMGMINVKNEAEIKLGDGSTSWFKIGITPAKNKSLKAYIFLTDINALHHTRADVYLKFSKMNEQLQGSSLTAWEYDFGDQMFIFSDLFFSMLRIDSTFNKIQASFLSNYIDMRYVKMLTEEIKIVEKNKAHNIDVVMPDLTGEVWMRFKGHYAEIDTPKGVYKSIMGVIEDISLRRKAEAHLDLLSNVFSKSKEGIVITNAKKEIIDVNDAFSNITGFTKGEALGKNPNILSSGMHDEKFYNKMWYSINTNGSWQGEMTNKKKNGLLYPQTMSIMVIKDKTNEITNYISIFTDISELKDKEQKLEQIAYYDALTGLANKKKFLDCLETFSIEAKASNKQFALLYMDLDGFKAANDTYGHSCGDEVLKEVARRLNAVLVNSDSPFARNNIVSRFGGDEFVVILRNFKKENYVIDAANEIIKTMGSTFVIGDYNVKIGITIGITYYPQKENINADTLLEQADWAMYQAKLAGKNCYYEFNESSSLVFKEYKNLLSRLETFDEDNFNLLYQPIYNIFSDEITAYEVRLQLKDTKTALSAGDLANLLSQKYWFSDLNIWIFENAVKTLEELNMSDLILQINTPISQISSNAFYKKFREFASGKDLSKVRILLSDIYTSRNPVSAVNEAVKKYEEFGVKFVVDEMDEKSSRFIPELNAKEIRISRTYSSSVTNDCTIIDKLIAIKELCKIEEKKVLVKSILSKQAFKIITLLGFEILEGDYIAKAVPKEEIQNSQKELRNRFKELQKIAKNDVKAKKETIELCRFLVFQVRELENVAMMLKTKNIAYFKADFYKQRFEELRAAQKEDVRFVCDEAYELIKHIHDDFKNIDINATLEQIFNEELKLLNIISGE